MASLRTGRARTDVRRMDRPAAEQTEVVLDKDHACKINFPFRDEPLCLAPKHSNHALNKFFLFLDFLFFLLFLFLFCANFQNLRIARSTTTVGNTCKDRNICRSRDLWVREQEAACTDRRTGQGDAHTDLSSA